MVNERSDTTWFGVKLWKTWRVDKAPLEHVEESLVAVKASDAQEAKRLALKLSKRDESQFMNEDGERVTIAISHADEVYATGEKRLRSGMELFSQVYELEDGLIDGGWPTA